MLSKIVMLIVYIYQLTKCRGEGTEEKSTSNQYLVWPLFFFKTASILLSTIADSFWRNSAGRLAQTSRRTNHISSVDSGSLWCFSSLHVIPDRFDDVEIRALWGPYHHFQDSLFFFTLMIVLNDFRCMFGVVVMLQIKFWANQMLPRWYCMMDKYLPVLLRSPQCWEVQADTYPSCNSIREASDWPQNYSAAWQQTQTYSESH